MSVGIDDVTSGGVYASADAARVGGGLYALLLDAACTLATDPAPMVAAQGAAALSVSSVKLTTLRSGALTTVASTLSSASLPMLQPAASTASTTSAAGSPALTTMAASLTSKLNGRFFRSAAPAATGRPSAGPAPAPPPAALCARPPYVLQHVHDGFGTAASVQEGQLSNAEAGPMAPISGRMDDGPGMMHACMITGLHVVCLQLV